MHPDESVDVSNVLFQIAGPEVFQKTNKIHAFVCAIPTCTLVIKIESVNSNLLVVRGLLWLSIHVIKDSPIHQCGPFSNSNSLLLANQFFLLQ